MQLKKYIAVVVLHHILNSVKLCLFFIKTQVTGGISNAAGIGCLKLWMLSQHVLPWNYAVITGTIQVLGICIFHINRNYLT
jgi:hypothetical protein